MEKLETSIITKDKDDIITANDVTKGSSEDTMNKSARTHTKKCMLNSLVKFSQSLSLNIFFKLFVLPPTFSVMPMSHRLGLFT